MLCEIPDPFAKKSDLDLWGTRVPLVAFKLLYDLSLLLLNKCHEFPPSS
jgi:hypothetical protein